MNQIQQSLSSLLRNPALQGEPGARRSAARPDAAQTSGATGESLEISSGAHQQLAKANARSVMPVVGDLAEARELTQVLVNSLQDGSSGPWQAHRSIDGQTANSLLR